MTMKTAVRTIDGIEIEIKVRPAAEPVKFTPVPSNS